MQLQEYLLKSVNVLNLVLIALVFLLAYHTVFPLLHPGVAYTSAALRKPTAEKNDPEAQPSQEPAPSPNDYVIVAEQNVFHPLRLIPIDKPPAPPLPKPDFVLFGTLVTGDLTLAYLEDKKAPQSTPGRGNRQAALKKGDTLSGFILRDVEPGKVVMARGEETITVHLNDASNPKTRVATAAAPTSSHGFQPASMQPAAPPPGPPGQPGTATATAQPTVQTPAPAGDAGAKGSSLRTLRSSRARRTSSYTPDD